MNTTSDLTGTHHHKLYQHKSQGPFTDRAQSRTHSTSRTDDLLVSEDLPRGLIATKSYNYSQHQEAIQVDETHHSPLLYNNHSVVQHLHVTTKRAECCLQRRSCSAGGTNCSSLRQQRHQLPTVVHCHGRCSEGGNARFRTKFRCK